MKICFIIPVYNHGAALEGVISSLEKYGLPFIVVDDGNDEKNKNLIAQACGKFNDVTLVVNEKNGGKGQAFEAGVKKALENGFTHAFQIDADGQHDSECCGAFIQAAAENPESLICGYPVYDESVPKHRKNGRKISNGFGKFVTVNGNVKDILCGCRIYPLKVYEKLLKDRAVMNHRMGFDIDILVHYLWKGCGIINLPVNVSYPADGLSNFHMVRDNLQISGVFARLTLGMVIRLPKLIYFAVRRRNRKGGNK